MSNQSKLLLILLLASSIIAQGCSNPLTWLMDKRAPEVYVPAGNVVELRGPHRIKVWTHDKQGNPVAGYINAWDRYLIGPAPTELTVPTPPPEKPKTIPQSGEEEERPKILANNNG